jgi:hypothetical protein
MFPEEEPKVTERVVVFCPDMFVAPAGTAHRYPFAPGTAAME